MPANALASQQIYGRRDSKSLGNAEVGPKLGIWHCVDSMCVWVGEWEGVREGETCVIINGINTFNYSQKAKAARECVPSVCGWG